MNEFRSRRPNITPETVASWRELAAQGKKRVEIARETGFHPSQVTRHLGAVQRYGKYRQPNDGTS